jgi:hypothetical protein
VHQPFTRRAVIADDAGADSSSQTNQRRGVWGVTSPDASRAAWGTCLVTLAPGENQSVERIECTNLTAQRTLQRWNSSSRSFEQAASETETTSPVVVGSKQEAKDTQKALDTAGFSFRKAPGAGYKLLCVIDGLAHANVTTLVLTLARMLCVYVPLVDRKRF